MGTHPIFESDFDCLTGSDMILRHLLRIKRYPALTLLNCYPRRCMMVTMLKRKDNEPTETFYTLLGIAENAEPMEIEDAFVQVLTDDELVIDATQVSTEESEAKLERSLRIIGRGDDPDKPRERHVKDGAFIKVEKDEIKKKNANEVVDELIGSGDNAANFMKTDFTHNVKMKSTKSATERAQLFGLNMDEINQRERQARQDYNELKKYSSAGMAVMFL